MSTSPPATTPVFRFAAQPLLVRRAAVLGAGTMGSRIAAHLANAGIPSLLLDMVPSGEGSRNKLAESALAALAKSKPAAFYDAALASMITPGNFEDDLPKLKQCDWVIEAVAENLEIKRALLDRVVPHLAPQAVLSTNTSGLPIAKIAAGLKSHRDRFFGTHFFNPPRYMQLLEIIPTAESDAALVGAFATFGDRVLGKQVVFANDTPNFIGNRIGVAVMFTAATLMLEQGLSIEEVDALTGPAAGVSANRDISPGRYGGNRHPGARRGEFSAGSDAGRLRGETSGDCEARLAGRQIRPGVLQEDARRRR